MSKRWPGPLATSGAVSSVSNWRTTCAAHWVSLVGSMDEALDRFNRSEQGQEFQEQASRVANRVRESALAAEMKDGLTVGLKAAANEVRKFADSLEEQQERSGSAQDIPVETEDDEKGEEKA